ncbi:MAG: hypothetical protein PHS01_08630 [Dysgonamonadaceae bacterium]|nr:hypothetical protein [Dysgonamonadaceae bacterium]
MDNRAKSSSRSWMENNNRVSLVNRDHSTEYSSAIRSIDRPIIKKIETRSQLTPIKLISPIVRQSIFRKNRNPEDEQLIELLSRFTWFNQMY